MRGGILALEGLLVRHPMEVLRPLIVFAITLAAGYVGRRLILRALRAWNNRTKSRPGRILTDSLRGPLIIWALILAVHFAIESSALPPAFTRWSPRVLGALWILSLTMMCVRMAGDLVHVYGDQIPGALPVTTLTRTLAQLAVVILGLLLLLNEIGFSITPILTALGVGGLAVALALNDTLSNLFAGLQIVAARQIRVGDYVKFDFAEGEVVDIDWHNTTIRDAQNNQIVVPNAKVNTNPFTNYSIGDSQQVVAVPATVAWKGSSEELLEIARAAAREAVDDAGGKSDEQRCSAAITAINETNLQVTAYLYVAGVTHRPLAVNSYLRRLHDATATGNRPAAAPPAR